MSLVIMVLDCSNLYYKLVFVGYFVFLIAKENSQHVARRVFLGLNGEISIRFYPAVRQSSAIVDLLFEFFVMGEDIYNSMLAISV